MQNNDLSVREMTPEDVPFVLEYWYTSSEEYLNSLGADLTKMPLREDFEKMLLKQVAQTYQEKMGYVIIWVKDGLPVGHSHVNKIHFGKEAFMHLHLWEASKRRRGMGVAFLEKSIPYYFENLKLEHLYCEPYALNPAPNKTLPKLGFEFIKKYQTIPGSINFEQEVCQYHMPRSVFKNRYQT